MGGENVNVNLSIGWDAEAARAFRYVQRGTEALAAAVLQAPEVRELRKSLEWAAHRYGATVGYIATLRAQDRASRWEPLPRVHAQERRWRKRLRKLSKRMRRAVARGLAAALAADMLRQLCDAAMVVEVIPAEPEPDDGSTWNASETYGRGDVVGPLSSAGAYRYRTGIEIASEQSARAVRTCNDTLRAIGRTSVIPAPPTVNVYLDGDAPAPAECSTWNPVPLGTPGAVAEVECDRCGCDFDIPDPVPGAACPGGCGRTFSAEELGARCFLPGGPT